MLGSNQENCLQALESGEFKQGLGLLHAIEEDGHHFCCLGVACKIFNLGKELDPEFGKKYAYIDGLDSNAETAPEDIVENLALYDSVGSAKTGITSLTQMNDGGKTFKEIAEIIRKNPKRWFKEPR